MDESGKGGHMPVSLSALRLVDYQAKTIGQVTRYRSEYPLCTAIRLGEDRRVVRESIKGSLLVLHRSVLRISIGIRGSVV